MRLFGLLAVALVGTAVAIGAPDTTTSETSAESAAYFAEPTVDLPPSAGNTLAIALSQTNVEPGHTFYFTRGAYGGGGGFRRRGGSWRTDYPEAEYYFTQLVSRLVDIDVYLRGGGANPMYLDDPNLRRYPFLYIVEPGGMYLSEPEVRGLRSYLEAGGFMMMDDFWGVRETANVEYQLAQVLPGRPIVEIPLDHPIFHSVYDIKEIRQVPNVRNGQAVGAGYAGARTDEGDNSEVPYVRGIFDDEGRLMVVINQNTDLGDAWEWAEDPYYPLDYSTYATEVGINTVVYAMTH